VILSSAKTGDYSSPYSIILAPGFTTSGPFIAAQPVNTTSKGYLVDEVIKVEGIKDDSQIYQLGAAQRQTTRTYVDGFGRPTQQIIVKGSPSQKDIVQNVVYDNLGMQTRTYLPYAASDGSGNFRTNAMNEQSAFYNNGSSDKIADDSKPYCEQIFEKSPLQRMMVSGGVGNGYQPGEHAVSLTYRLNVGSDGVRRWHADGSTASDYVAGSLSVLVSTDQQGNQSIVFKDIAGNIVLKKQQLDGNISGQNVSWLETYYVYDDLGKIRYVVPPKAVAILQSAANRNLDQGSINQLLFHYVYDDKGRTVERTVPGGATMYMIEPLGYSYFNDYDLDGNGTADYTYANQGLSGEDSAVFNIRGMATVVRKRTIGSGLNNIWLTSVIFYNKRGVAIQTLSNNQLNAAVNNTKTVVADFTGKPLLSKTVRVANSVSTTVLTTMGYDHMDRVLTVDEKVNTNPTLRVASYEYNEIGQLVDKKLNSTNSGDSYLQSVDFRYSIRGQMLSINNSSLSVDDKNDDSNDVFGLQFSYDQTDAAIGNTPYYNGMISAVKW
jgi:hypothetical protein